MNENIDNRSAYKQDKVVRIYTGTPKLFKGEEALIKKYKSELADATFLDIGVGGGRTTHFIQPIVKKYFGVDYSQNFVDHVAEQYSGQTNTVIQFGDARNLHQYSENFFDFILFSFNGIDCVNYADREQVIREMFRLLKPGGHFWFSFHNIYSVPKLYSFQWPRNPLNWMKEWQRLKKVKQLNEAMSNYLGVDYCFLRDGAELFEADVMYIKPELQNDLLKKYGFSQVSYYDAQSGGQLATDTKAHTIDWIYADAIK